MINQIKYQVFLSSTFEDLREERHFATQSILTMGYFPSGMELFPASDDAQWDLIKRVIEEADYYVVIVGGRYGTLSGSGLSFTELEYDFAVENNVPVLGFVRDNIDEIPAKFTEGLPEKREMLSAFREKVMSKTCVKYNSPNELGMAVMASLTHEVRVRPRVGWVRANQARSEDDIERERKLSEELEQTRKDLEIFDRELRDRDVLGDEIAKEQLSQGDDLVLFNAKFKDKSNRYSSLKVSVTWNEVFSAIAPTLYGFIMAKAGRYNQRAKYSFEENIEELLRTQIIDEVGSRKIDIAENEIDACIFQFKELGLIKFTESENEDGTTFRGISLTKLGEREITRLKTQTRSVSSN